MVKSNILKMLPQKKKHTVYSQGTPVDSIYKGRER